MEYDEAKAYDEGYADGLAAGRGSSAPRPEAVGSVELAVWIRSLGAPSTDDLAQALVNRYTVTQ